MAVALAAQNQDLMQVQGLLLPTTGRTGRVQLTTGAQAAEVLPEATVYLHRPTQNQVVQEVIRHQAVAEAVTEVAPAAAAEAVTEAAAAVLIPGEAQEAR